MAYFPSVRAAIALLAMVGVFSACGDPQQQVLPTNFEELKLVQEGGYGPMSPPGAPCQLSGPQTMTVTASSRLLTWDVCQQDSTTGQVAGQTGSRTLTVSEFADVQNITGAVTISHASNCGEDDSVVTLDLQTSSGLELYADDFYSGCPQDGEAGRTFVTSLTNLDNKLWALIPM